MKVLIVEDEFYAFERLAFLLRNQSKSIEIAPSVASVRDAVALLRKENFDLVFMDVHLSDGLCFSIFEQVALPTPVIFTTAYDQYAIRAFKVNSVDYLLKPIRKEELSAALEKFGNLQRNFAGFRLSDEYNLKNSFKNRFVIKVGEYIKMVSINDVSCFYSLDKGTFLHTVDDHNYLIDYSLDELMVVLQPDIFFRVNRKYILRIDQIKDIIAWSNSRLRITMKTPTDDEIVVARERVKDFKIWLGWER
ncbi:MAG: response regulator transcription factor [Bacteroidales bacterium]|nr:response regulator transcription factor [Bacteroidales bacterium]